MGLYKIECYSQTGVSVVTETIESGGGKHVVEGLAIVTNYSFNSTETRDIIACVARTHDDLTTTDMQAFIEANL